MYQSFLLALNNFFVKKEYRNRSLNLLCKFVQSQPPHLHLVLQTPLFENILKSLQQDESTTTVSLGLVSLFMLLPNMPGSLVPHLPTLFNIYARLLFWDRDRSFAQEHAQWEPESKPGGTPGWDKCLFDNDLDGDSIHHLSTYFTILYGLYPLNFVDYIRKPQRYLRHANNTDDIDVQAMEIRDRSERFRRCHLLHPNFYQLTVDSEKTDFSRWLKSEPAEVITDCMNLCVPMDGGGVQPEERSEPLLPEPGISSPRGTHDGTNSERPLLSRVTSSHDAASPTELGDMSVTSPSAFDDSRDQSDLIQKPFETSRATTRDTSARPSLDVRARDVAQDSPTLPAQLAKAASHAQLQEMIHSNKIIKSSLHQLANDSVPSLALSNTDSYHDSGFLQLQPAHRAASSLNTAELLNQIAALQRQALLLQNDLNFESFMKQQHMAHVGALRRKQLREAATEAEAQNLIMANRSLKYRLEESQRKEAQIRKEADHRRNMAKKWESSQSDKLRHFRELQKKWTMDETLLKNDLNAAREECEQLRKRVVDLEAQQHNWQQDSETFEAGKEQTRKLKEEIQKLSASERKYQGMEIKMRTSMEEARQAESRAEQKVLAITARENQLVEEHKRYEEQIADLQKQLAEAKSTDREQERQEKAKEIAAQVYDFRAMQNKYVELQKQYALVRKKYQVAQASLLDLQCDMEEKRSDAFWAAQNEARTKSRESGSGSEAVSLRSRVMSDPEVSLTTSSSDGTASFNATAPLPGNASISKGTGTGFQYHSQQRPGLVPTASEEMRTQRTISAGDVRYFSRGKSYFISPTSLGCEYVLTSPEAYKITRYGGSRAGPERRTTKRRRSRLVSV